MQTARTAVIILNWNGWKDTIACAQSVLALDGDPVSIFICDNGSSDGSVAKLQAWIDGNRDRSNAITMIETGGNLGYAGGNNVGLRAAFAGNFDRFWILNSDTIVQPDALHWLLERMAADKSIGLCGSTLLYGDRPHIVQNYAGGSFNCWKGQARAIGFGASAADPIEPKTIEAQLAFVSGAAMLVSRAFIERIGLMEENYFLYWEELDWAARAKGAFKLGFAPLSKVHHKVGASIGTDDFGNRSALSEYYLARNRLRFCWLHSKLSLPFVAADSVRQLVQHCINSDWWRARALGRAMIGLPHGP